MSLGKSPGKMPKIPGFLQQVIIHLESVNRCAANGCSPGQSLPIAAPAEMFIPTVYPRIKEPDLFSGLRVNPLHKIALGNVAMRAGEAQVVGRRSPSGG